MPNAHVVLLCLEARVTGGTLRLSEEHDASDWVAGSAFAALDLPAQIRAVVLDCVQRMPPRQGEARGAIMGPWKRRFGKREADGHGPGTEPATEPSAPRPAPSGSSTLPAAAAGLDRQIRVFVSSTFRDMHAEPERDHLVTVIFPQLRRLREARGVTWGEVDLRWGVTDEEAAEGKVLPICLEEIRRCRPYFFGLLGERYGWVPQSIPAELLEQEAWLQEEFREHKSVTELEILHGVLRSPAMAAAAPLGTAAPGAAR
jgi:hypothetical protein